MADRPSESITFLFTDIEESTRLWERSSEVMNDDLAGAAVEAGASTTAALRVGRLKSRLQRDEVATPPGADWGAVGAGH